MKLFLIIHDIRSTHNVGSLLRTAECLGIEHVYITGYSPYPSLLNDSRLPHIHQKLTKQIIKTSLGAESLVTWEYSEDVSSLIDTLRASGVKIAGLEQDASSITLQLDTLKNHFSRSDTVALIIGREVEGIESSILLKCDYIIEIPMKGKKESLNVSVATGIALFALKQL